MLDLNPELPQHHAPRHKTLELGVERDFQDLRIAQSLLEVGRYPLALFGDPERSRIVVEGPRTHENIRRGVSGVEITALLQQVYLGLALIVEMETGLGHRAWWGPLGFPRDPLLPLQAAHVVVGPGVPAEPAFIVVIERGDRSILGDAALGDQRTLVAESDGAQARVDTLAMLVILPPRLDQHVDEVASLDLGLDFLGRFHLGLVRVEDRGLLGFAAGDDPS